jgi:hypothetical protein
MAIATAALSSTIPGGKASLEAAYRSFRLSNFDEAFKQCSEAVASAEFSSWKDKKRHDVVKSYIVFGKHAGRYARGALARH